MTHRTCLVPSIAKLAIYGGLALGMSAGVQQFAYAETMSVASETGPVRSASGSAAPTPAAPAPESNSDPGTTPAPAAPASSSASATTPASAPAPAPAPTPVAAPSPESSTPDYWLREFKPTLPVAQYAKTTVSAYDKDGKKLASLDDEKAVRYEGTVELNIPVGTLLSSPPAAPHEGESGSATPASAASSTSTTTATSTPAPADSSEERPDYYNSWPDRKPFESLAHRDKGPVFNYVLSLPDLTTLTPSFATPNPAPVPAPLSWSSATIRNTFAYIDGDTISVSIQGNKAIFSAHTKSGLTWRESSFLRKILSRLQLPSKPQLQARPQARLQARPQAQLQPQLPTQAPAPPHPHLCLQPQLQLRPQLQP